MNVSNTVNEEGNGTTNEPSSSPPPSSPSTDVNDPLPAEENAGASSGGDRSEMDEQPVLISPEYLPAVTQMVESLGPRRVKVYELRGEVWVDLGTGFCQGYVENVGVLTAFSLTG